MTNYLNKTIQLFSSCMIHFFFNFDKNICAELPFNILISRSFDLEKAFKNKYIYLHKLIHLILE